jgi:hypothetical protein
VQTPNRNQCSRPLAAFCSAPMPGQTTAALWTSARPPHPLSSAARLSSSSTSAKLHVQCKVSAGKHLWPVALRIAGAATGQWQAQGRSGFSVKVQVQVQVVVQVADADTRERCAWRCGSGGQWARSDVQFPCAGHRLRAHARAHAPRLTRSWQTIDCTAIAPCTALGYAAPPRFQRLPCRTPAARTRCTRS